MKTLHRLVALLLLSLLAFTAMPITAAVPDRPLTPEDRAEIGALLRAAADSAFNISQHTSFSPEWYTANGRTVSLLGAALTVQSEILLTTTQYLSILEAMQAGMLWWTYYFTTDASGTAFLDGRASGFKEAIRLVRIALDSPPASMAEPILPIPFLSSLRTQSSRHEP